MEDAEPRDIETDCPDCYYISDVLLWAANNAKSEDVRIFAGNLLDEWSK